VLANAEAVNTDVNQFAVYLHRFPPGNDGCDFACKFPPGRAVLIYVRRTGVTGFINGSPSRLPGPQELKPAFLLALNGTAKAVPYPNHL